MLVSRHAGGSSPLLGGYMDSPPDPHNHSLPMNWYPSAISRAPQNYLDEKVLEGTSSVTSQKQPGVVAQGHPSKTLLCAPLALYPTWWGRGGSVIFKAKSPPHHHSHIGCSFHLPCWGETGRAARKSDPGVWKGLSESPGGEVGGLLSCVEGRDAGEPGACVSLTCQPPDGLMDS